MLLFLTLTANMARTLYPNIILGWLNHLFLFSTFFYKETCYLSAVYTPTSFLGLHTMTAIAVHLDKYKNETIFEDSIQAMTAKFLKYWGAGKVPLIYGFGAILDCRCKIGGLKKFLKYIRNHFEDQDYVALDLARIMQAFYDLFRV